MRDEQAMLLMTVADKKVIMAYADTGMNVRGTARKLNYYHGTIKYHLDTVRAKTGYNPRDFHDLAHLVDLIQSERQAYEESLRGGGEGWS